MTWGRTGIPTGDGIQPFLVTQICSLGVLLDPLLHLGPQMAGIARSAFLQLHLVRRL